MDRSVFFNLTNSVHSSLRQKRGPLLRFERIHSKSYYLDTFPRRQKMIPVAATRNDVLSPNEISFQGFIAHASLGRFLFLASKVKTLRLSFIAKTVPNPSEVSILLDTEHKETQEHEQNEMASYVRERLLGRSFEKLCLNDTNETVSSMMNESQHFLDSLMYDSIQVLLKDLEHCMKWYARMASSQSLVNSSARVTRIPVHRNDNGKNSKKGSSDAIAVKYSKEQTDILTNWMIEHKVGLRIWCGFRRSLIVHILVVSHKLPSGVFLHRVIHFQKLMRSTILQKRRIYHIHKLSIGLPMLGKGI
jgi:hypothetical protein